MGCLLTAGRIFLIVTNIFFLVIGLIFFVVGLIGKFGDSILKSYYQGIITSLESSLTSAGYSNVKLNFNISDLLGNLTLAFILTGVLLLILTIVGFLGACKKIKCMLIIYALVVFALIAAEVITAGIFYWKPEMITKPIKETLNSTIKSDYAGLNGTNVVSIAWNFVNQQFSCCGIDNYYDFIDATNWVRDNLATPLTCCITLPSSTDLSCAQNPLTTSKNNYNKGCFDAIWNLALGNTAITASVLAVVLVMQIIFFLTAICMYADNSNKVHPEKGGKKK